MINDFHTEFSWDFHGFPEVSASFCHVNPPKKFPEKCPNGFPQNDGSTRGKSRKNFKGWISSEITNSKKPHKKTHKHTHKISKTPGVFLKSFRHFLRFFSFLGPSWSTLIRRVKCLNKRRSKWAGPGLNACQAVTVQKTLYATCFKGGTWDLGDLPMMTDIFRTNLGDIYTYIYDIFRIYLGHNYI